MNLPDATTSLADCRSALAVSGKRHHSHRSTARPAVPNHARHAKTTNPAARNWAEHRCTNPLGQITQAEIAHLLNV